MTNAEYLAIFESDQLIRSPVVRLLEEQIRILFVLSEAFARYEENELTTYCRQKAEETKWEAICIAEHEKKNGMIDLIGGD